MLKPAHFDTLIECARNIAGFQENDGTANRNSCALWLRNQKSGSHCTLPSSEKNGHEKKEEIDVFLQLYDAERHKKVTTPALDNLNVKKHNKPEVLPLTNNLLALRKYLVERIASLTDNVRKSTTRSNWRELAEVTLARLIMFNKRRGKYHHCY